MSTLQSMRDAASRGAQSPRRLAKRLKPHASATLCVWAMVPGAPLHDKFQQWHSHRWPCCRLRALRERVRLFSDTASAGTRSAPTQFALCRSIDFEFGAFLPRDAVSVTLCELTSFCVFVGIFASIEKLGRWRHHGSPMSVECFNVLTEKLHIIVGGCIKSGDQGDDVSSQGGVSPLPKSAVQSTI